MNYFCAHMAVFHLYSSCCIFIALDGNKAPEANAGPDVFVKLPNRAAALDGSSSSDDYGIVSYSWTRDLKSPAAGVSKMIYFN